MIVLGFILAILGDWALPTMLPEFPPRLDNLFFVVGVILILAGLIALVFGFTGRTLGGRRWWY